MDEGLQVELPQRYRAAVYVVTRARAQPEGRSGTRTLATFWFLLPVIEENQQWD